MASLAKTVEHLGRVQEISLNDIKVAIQPQASCAGCQAQAVCGANNNNEKFVVVHKLNHNFIVGESVKVILLQSIGYRAVFLGYIMPFIIVILSLATFVSVGINEGLSGLFSLLVLIPYYFIVYFFRKNISEKINFDIQKI